MQARTAPLLGAFSSKASTNCVRVASAGTLMSNDQPVEALPNVP
jgi:hypothetical protein